MSKQSPLKFPCSFPIKVIGKTSETFATDIYNIFLKHFPNLSHEAINFSPSKSNKYIALTITVTAESKKQLDAVYQELSQNSEVLFTI